MSGSDYNISGWDAIPAPVDDGIIDAPVCHCEECGAPIYDGEECVEATITLGGKRETIYYCAKCATPTWAGRRI